MPAASQPPVPNNLPPLPSGDPFADLGDLPPLPAAAKPKDWFYGGDETAKEDFFRFFGFEMPESIEFDTGKIRTKGIYFNSNGEAFITGGFDKLFSLGYVRPPSIDETDSPEWWAKKVMGQFDDAKLAPQNETDLQKPNVMVGYLDPPERNFEPLLPSWLRSSASDHADLTYRLRRDTEEILRSLTKPGDPPIFLEWGKKYKSTEVSTSIDPLQGAVIKVEPGALALTGNLSEFAGVLALALAKIRPAFEERQAELVEELNVPEDREPMEFLREELEKAANDKSPEGKERQRLLVKAFQFSQQLEIYEKRKDNRDLKQVLADTGFKIDLEGDTEKNLRAVIDAVDRMVGALDGSGSTGGFDPWGIVGPKRRFAEIERYGGKQKGIFQKILAHMKEQVKKGHSDALELEFMEKYVLVLENREEGNFARLKFRGQDLTPEQLRVRQAAKATQTWGFGPAMTDATIVSGLLMLAFGGWWKGAQVFEGTGTLIKNFMDWIGNLFPKREPAPQRPPEGPGWWSRLWNSIGEWWDGLRWPEGWGWPENWRWPRNWTPEWLREIGDRVWGGSGWVFDRVLGPAADLVAHYGWETAKFAVPAALLYSAERALTSPLRVRTAKFLSRYRHNIAGQARQLRDITRASRGNPTNGDLAELLSTQNLLTDFMQDGENPDLERIKNRVVYQLLFDSGRFWHLFHKDLNRALDGFRREVNERVTEILKEEARQRTGSEPKKLSNRQIAAAVRQLTFPDLMLHPRDAAPVPDNAQVKESFDRYAESIAKNQQLLYWLYGALATLAAETNTRLLLNLIDKKLADPKTTPQERVGLETMLRRFEAVDLLGPKAHRDYTQVWKKHFPESPIGRLNTVDDLATAWESQGKEVPAFVLELRARQLAGNKSLTVAELAHVFRLMASNGMYTDAAVLLHKRLHDLAPYMHDKNVPEKVRAETRGAMRTVFNNWKELEFGFGLSAIGRSWLKKALILRATGLKDKNVRLAFGTHLMDAAEKTAGPIDLLVLDRYGKRLTKQGGAESAGALMDSIETLHRDYDVESRFLAELFHRHLSTNPELIKRVADIHRVLESDQPWHRLDSVASESAVAWEQKLFDRYAELAQRYPSYNYNPGHSEQIQQILLDRFNQLHPGASVDEKIDLWRKMAERGPGGVTDAFIDSILETIPEARSAEVAAEALNKGLIWDPQIRSRLYKRQASSRINGETLAEVDKKAWGDFVGKVQDVQRSKPRARELSTRVAELTAEAEGFEFDDPAAKDRLKQALIAALTPTGKDRHANTRERREGRGQSYPDARSLLNPFSGHAHSTPARQAVIDAEIETLHKFFPESGYAVASMLDWMSHRLRTRHGEAIYVKNKFLDQNTDQKDLAVSVLNEIIEDANKWDPVDKWRLIRWLRGSGSVPDVVKRKMRRMGPETVRRLYSTLPVFVRSSFVSTLLGAPRVGLLEGMGKRLYYEQILNEIMPRNEMAADIAGELLESFLVAMEKVSNPAKRRAVLSYLLAHSVEHSDTGSVLKNLLEAYGVPGIKLGQILAAGDFLPDHVRSKLSELHDRAKEPFRHEVFERIAELMKVDRIEPLFVIEDLKGAASMKYAVTVIDRQGKRHLIQVKREEAEAALMRNFEEMKVIVEELIRRSPSRYAFLKGMVQATVDAIRRELSLVREGVKAEVAKEEYRKLDLGKDVRVEVAQTSPLVEDVARDPGALHYLRSSEFASGGNLRSFPKEAQKRMAQAILQGEANLWLPEDGRTTHVDPDRHPGNIIWAMDKDAGELLYRYKPIDWGQQFQLTQADRDRVIRLMAYSQLFEHIGPEPNLVESLIKEFGIQPADAGIVRRGVRSYFPNKSGKPRSILGPYYYVLSALENAGMKSDILHYDMIKGIFQLEVYEELARGEKHVSPKAAFREQVLKQVIELSKTVDSTTKGKMRYALTKLDPAAWRVAGRNASLHQESKLALDGFLAEMGVSQPSRDKAMAGLGAQRLGNLNNAFELATWMEHVAKSDLMKPEDAELVRRWLSHPRFASVRPNLSALSMEDLRNVMNTYSVLTEINSRAEKMRKIVPQPEKHSFLVGVRDVYLAEFLNSIFWSLYDQKPELARSWLASLGTVGKHAGFAAFAMTHSGVQNLTNRIVPRSRVGTRYLFGNGLGVALSMAASDIVHRALNGESFEEIWSEVGTSDYAIQLGWNTATFLGAEAVSGAGFSALGKHLPKSVRCNYFFHKLAPLTTTFIMSEAVDRTAGEWLRQRKLLPVNELKQFDAVAIDSADEIEAALAEVEKLYREKKYVEALRKFLGVKLDDGYFKDGIIEDGVMTLDPDNIERLVTRSLEGTPTPDSVMGVMKRYHGRLYDLQRRFHGIRPQKMVAEEIKASKEHLVAFLRDWFDYDIGFKQEQIAKLREPFETPRQEAQP